MSQNLDKLRTDYEKAEQAAQKLMAEKDDAFATYTKVRNRVRDRLRDANDKAAAAQKALNDAEAADALKDRPDGDRVAASLGLTLD